VRGEITQIDNRVVILTCPWYLLVRSPAVRAVSEWYEWREVGGLQWNALSSILAQRAVTAFGRGVAHRRASDWEKEKKEAERKRGK